MSAPTSAAAPSACGRRNVSEDIVVLPGIARLSCLALLVVNLAVGNLATRNRQAS